MASRLDLHDLRCFLAVAEERSIRKAAERLHVSQPPLSRRIRQLEVRLGMPLLSRATTGVTLTHAGETLREHAARIVADVDGIVDALRQGATPGRVTLRLGASAAVPLPALRRVVLAWKRAMPGRIGEVPTTFSPDLVAQLREGTLDLALVGLPGDVRGLETRPVFSEPLVAAMPASHPAARKRVVALQDFAGMKLFWGARAVNPAFHDATDRTLRACGFRPRYVTVEPGSFLTLERIAQGEGFTIFNRFRAGTRVAGVAYRPLVEGEKLAIQVVAAWKPGKDLDRDAERLAAIARRVLGDRAAKGR